MDFTPDISIIVCSAGRRASLAALFSSFAKLKLPEAGAAEVILVDNSPKGTLAPVFETLRAKLTLPTRYVAEPRCGLAMAQNRGLEVARGEVVAFTDDDCLVAEDWLLRLAEHFRRHPELQGLGGRIELYDPADRPVTIKPVLEREELAQPDQLFGFLHGCNMAFRRAFLANLGGFDTRFGAGSVIGAGNDTELLYRAYRAGCRIAYEPDVLVFHDHGRRGWWQVRALVNTYQMANGALLMKHVANGDEQAKRLFRNALGRPFLVLARRPLALAESARALHRMILFSVGALRYRLLPNERT
ncbi:MAG: glycosyltransferase [Pseudomonadota bacterium]